MTPTPTRFRFPQVKICGLTRPDEAARCAALGADAIGLVFFPKSPRNVSVEQARAVVAALPDRVAAVGVFVDADFGFIMSRVEGCGLSMAQLHGRETPALVDRLTIEGVGVIKGLFIDGQPGLDAADGFAAHGFLVECAKGPLPGGNAMAWDWGAARDFGQHHPLVLAGGLTPENVAAAIAAARPAAIDVSSGVEATPGRKDADKVARLLQAVNKVGYQASASFPPVFRPRGGRCDG
ncbi:phosphoribosylanthranilate isomerase [Desulfosarcina ovata]|uniref:N-(5'-phosphoribosyl)anthranilate isomerase n=1 Tax=Desulfosarcina ovata subsp. ovata TaxID=2752305 RepID=A0A5K8AHI0_9BACT|nr:phosphoribosylanthranilate isomerase [Desulfosarcina ovata]BBO92153.1 N-(5'-phosphoribosyl)anthranilate isomerase [Desulfosarcina ovata subsp. ovata]